MICCWVEHISYFRPKKQMEKVTEVVADFLPHKKETKKNPSSCQRGVLIMYDITKVIINRDFRIINNLPVSENRN